MSVSTPDSPARRAGLRTLLALALTAGAATLLPAAHAADAKPVEEKASAATATPRVELKTNLGTIVLELDATKAPKTVENFLQYTKDGFYAGTLFHRVIPGFMVQGGGFDKNLREKSTRAPIPNEAKNGLRNLRGTIAMARTQDPHSATAQFFINHVDNAMLDYPSRDGWGYAVFGKVVSGMDVVEKIATVPTGNVGPYGDVPRTPVIIESARILPAGSRK